MLELAAGGLGPRAIAERLRLTDRTVRTHLADPSAAADLRRLTDDRLRLLARRALAAAEDAPGVLSKVAGDDAQPGMARVGAARAILDNAAKLVVAADLAERLAALEQQLDRQ